MTRVGLALIRPSVLAMDWVPLLVASVVSWGFTTAAILATDPAMVNRVMNTTISLRVSPLLLGAAAGFALVDTVTPAVAATPVPRWLRQWVRTVLVLAAATASWLVTLMIASIAFPGSSRLPGPDMALEAAVCVLTALGCTSLALRRRQDRLAGVAGATIFVILAGATLFMTGPLWPWPWIGDPAWPVVHRGWLMVLPVPLALIFLGNRDQPHG